MKKIEVKLRELRLEIILLSLLMLILSSFLVNILIGEFSIKLPSEVYIFILSIISTIVLHEATHILALRLCGYQRIKVGIAARSCIPCVYVKVSENKEIPRSNFILVALSPLIFLTLVLVPILMITNDPLQKFFSFVFVFNIGGCAGDIILVAVVLASGSRIVEELNDRGLGIVLYVEDLAQFQRKIKLIKLTVKLIFIVVILVLLARFKIEIVVHEEAVIIPILSNY